MIITKQKKFNELLNLIDNRPVFIIGCNECATLCHTGGESEILSMKNALENKKIKVTGWVILEPACHLNNDKRILRKYKKNIDEANKIVVFACGNGVQTISEIIDGANLIAGNNTLFLGEIKRANEFIKRCNMCGDCDLHLFGGLCPVSLCAKSMLNGPCGGSTNGKCEVDSNLNCIWCDLYEFLKRKNKLQLLKEIRKPKDWSKSDERKRLI